MQAQQGIITLASSINNIGMQNYSMQQMHCLLQ